MKTTRSEVICRALILIEMLNSGPITIHDVAERFGVTRQVAYRWINVASIVLPIYESGQRHVHKFGRPVVEYRLIKDN